MTSLLASDIIWQPDDYIFFKKCGEITISPDIKNIGFNCLFCTGVCLESEIFLQHLQEQHKEEVYKLYENEKPSTLFSEESSLMLNNLNAELMFNSNEINLQDSVTNTVITTNNTCINSNHLENQELKENFINLNICIPMQENALPIETDLNLMHEKENNNLMTVTSSNQDLQNLIQFNPCENLLNNIKTFNNSASTLTTTPTFELPSSYCNSGSFCMLTCLPDDNEGEIGDGEDSGIMLVQQSPCHSDCSGLSDCMLFTEDSSSKSTNISDENISIPDKGTDIQSEPMNNVKGKYYKTPAMRKALINKELIKYLLEIYKNNEKLWNPKDPAYKYNAPRTIYQELSESLLKDKKFSLTGDEIFRIITELRGRYRRELKKIELRKGKHKTRLWFFDKMQFLRPIIEDKRKERGKDKENRYMSDSVESKLTNRQILSHLLDLYRKTENLWNPKHQDFGTCNKQEFYKRISKRLREKIDIEMTHVECSIQIQKLCVRYRKELRIFYKLKGLYLPKLWCFDEMEFLKPVLEEKIIKDLKKNNKTSSCLFKRNCDFRKSNEIKFDNLEQQLEFIEIYRNFNSLWDVDHPDYRSTYYRQRSLNDMFKNINILFKNEKILKLEQLEKTLYLLCKDFSNEKHKRLTKNYSSKSNDMSFIVYEKLNEFLGINLGPFPCDYCQQICKTYDQYKMHKSKHDNSIPFTCTLCGKGFQISGNLTIHLRRHRKDFPYSCEVCNKSFATSTEVNIHMRSHTGERPYVCECCDKTFKTWSFYDLHRRIHLNQSNFHCPICDKAFYERNRFTDHMNLHLNIRKHQCHQCHKSFTTIGNLKKHMELHASIKQYKCLPCGKSYAQLASLRWHRKSQHEH